MSIEMGVGFVIVFDKLWVIMREQHISTYQLREKCGIDSKTIRRLKANDNMETKTLNKLCAALHCRLEDIAEYIEARLKRKIAKSRMRAIHPMPLIQQSNIAH